MTYLLMFIGAWLLIVSGICAVLTRHGVRARDHRDGV